MRLLLVYLLTRALAHVLIHSFTFTSSFIHTFTQSSAPLFIHLSTHTLIHWSFVPSPIHSTHSHTPSSCLPHAAFPADPGRTPACCYFFQSLGAEPEILPNHCANPRHPRNVLSSPLRHPLEPWSSCLPLYQETQQPSEGCSLHLSLGMVSASVLLKKMKKVQKDPAPVPGDGWSTSEVT